MITEGRKDELLSKYPNISSYVKDYLDNSEYQKKTNYKYAAWVLKQYFKGDSEITYLEHVDDTLEKFDKYSKNLEKKDINQYDTYSELTSVINDYTKNKVVDNDVVKIIDNDTIIIVRPKTHSASCKYGSGTKWCTTMDDESYFKRYTSQGSLYYIHLKTIGKDNEYYKMAINVDNNGDKWTWYTAKDEEMSTKEIKLAKMLIGVNNIELIVKDVNELVKVNTSKVFHKIIEYIDEANGATFVTPLKEYGIEKIDVVIKFLDNPNIYENKSLISNIIIESKEDNFKGQIKGSLIFRFRGEDNNYEFFIEFHGEKYLGIFDIGEKLDYGRNWFFNEYRDFLLYFHELIKSILKKPKVLSVITNGKLWRPQNAQSTYTFMGKGKLTSQLKDYMEKLGKDGKGSKIDFLTSIGRVKEKSPNVFYLKDSNIEINIRGYMSTFFSSLKDAGIIEYVRDGRRFMFKRGPNYNEFIEGSLKRI